MRPEEQLFHPLHFLRKTCLLTLALTVATASAWAQEASFGETVDVQLVEVEVWVTDQDGIPVPGLSVEDFIVKEDGKPVTVSHFREVQGAPQQTASAPPLEPKATPQRLPRPAPTRAPGHLIFYFDQNHLKPATRNRMIQDIRLFLVSGEVAPQRVLILSQSERLETVAPFGSSLPKLEQALDRLEALGANGGRFEAEKRREVLQLQVAWREDADCNRFLPNALSQVNRYANETGARVQATLGNLETATIFLAGLPGVKTLVYVSDSLETAPGNDLMAFVESLCSTAFRSTTTGTLSNRLRDEFTQLTQKANAGRVTFYTMQAKGLGLDFLGGADQQMVEFQGGNEGGFESALRNNERGGHLVLADETGGETILNTNRFLPQLKGIARVMDSYYSLAYEPPHGGDGGFHRIKVTVPGKKVNVRHRLDYRHKDADDHLADRLESTSFLGYSSNPLGMRIGIGEVRPWSRNRVSFPVHVQVPVDQLTFLPHGGRPTAQVTIRIAARDTETDKVVYHQKVQQTKRPPAKVQAIDFSAVFKVEKGNYVVAAGLRDDASRESAFIRTFVDLREQDESKGKKRRRGAQ